ncbi:substrate-binding periplasmic protein [Noviherbaspirillum galbum]|uniref:Amino acid ABC transporter substrate-binding protein n=1 Tax=Noviherbaspirillum galbum TaxID=2709383 RepID=A0A6B3SU35_9BURK|nr:transporter substrate-binding domain-containing protein [Noviherbaspirillum galbum]NEX63978.1 amino acid ABC transporter substrate-binding protein [Noviherbaspirillum galbum]
MFLRMCIAALSCHIALTVQAADLVVNAGDIIPFCYEADGRQSGIAVDILQEVGKGTGIDFSFRFLPWKRAQLETMASKNQGVIPLSRTPEREKQYQWIAPLFEYQFILVTRAGTPAPKTIDEAKHMAVGVLRGNPMEALLPQLGFTRVIPGNTEEIVAKQLKTRVIDAWVVADLVVMNNYKRAGGDPSELVLGPRIGDPMAVYLGGSPEFSENDKRLISAEVARLRQNGGITRILARYKPGL